MLVFAIRWKLLGSINKFSKLTLDSATYGVFKYSRFNLFVIVRLTNLYFESYNNAQLDN